MQQIRHDRQTPSRMQRLSSRRPCELDLGQLKILQEVITLSVFVPFLIFYMGQALKLDYLWAALCILGAVYFVFWQ